MAITITTQTPVYTTGNTTFTKPTVNKGDLLIAFLGTKPQTSTNTASAGWDIISGATGNGGQGTTGIDTGQMRVECWKRYVDGAEASTFSFTNDGNNSVTGGAIYKFIPSAGNYIAVHTASLGNDTTTGTGFSAASATTMDLQAGDYVFCVGVIPTDVGAGAQFATPTLSASGMTFTGLTEHAEMFDASGQDMGGVIWSGNISAGTRANVTVTAGITASGTTTNVAGPIAMIGLREYPAPLIDYRNKRMEAINRGSRW